MSIRFEGKIIHINKCYYDFTTWCMMYGMVYGIVYNMVFFKIVWYYIVLVANPNQI